MICPAVEGLDFINCLAEDVSSDTLVSSLVCCRRWAGVSLWTTTMWTPQCPAGSTIRQGAPVDFHSDE